MILTLYEWSMVAMVLLPLFSTVSAVLIYRAMRKTFPSQKEES